MIMAILLSGGTGTRIHSDIPKQYIKVNNRPIITYSIETLSKNDNINGIYIVASEEWRDNISSYLKEYDINHKFIEYVEPGETRQLSIYNALLEAGNICRDNDMVLVHDAARPMLKPATIDALVEKISSHKGVVPVLPMKDTVYYSDDMETLSNCLKRQRIFAGQAPELFIYGDYVRANEALINYNENHEIDIDSPIWGISGSSEPAVLAGMDVAMIKGDEGNYKVTTDEDLNRLRRILER